MMYVLVKEHGLTVSYRWYDVSMKEVLTSVVDATVCK